MLGFFVFFKVSMVIVIYIPCLRTCAIDLSIL